jgi:hypothetical protein
MFSTRGRLADTFLGRTHRRQAAVATTWTPRAASGWLMLPVLLCLAVHVGVGADVSLEKLELPRIAVMVDEQIEQRLAEEGVVAAPQADDATFLRRVTLDLAGRIPTTSELEEFLRNPDSAKRLQVIDRLMQSPDFAYHLRNEFDLLLLARLRHDAAWREYLLEATRENRGWDQLFREVLVPDRQETGAAAELAASDIGGLADGGLDGIDGAETHVAAGSEGESARKLHEGAAAFLRHRAREVDDLTNDTCVVFFGVNVSCAKCHDHPLVSDWEQDHYYGMAAFFHRTYLTKKNQLAERFTGMPRFTTIYGEEKTAAYMFLSGRKIEEPQQEWTDERRKELDDLVRRQQREDDPGPLQLPDFSPREALVQLALDADGSSMLARAAVNRVWARLMGRGLVEPLDQMHSENPPSHPDLLDWLSDEFRQEGYDLRHLIRGLVSSRTYGRSSRWKDGETPAPELFAVATARPLTPRQMGLSLHLASLHPDLLAREVADPTVWGSRRERLESQADGAAGLFEIPHENFQVSVDEALLFSNSERFMREYLQEGSERLVGYLVELDEPASQVQGAYRAVLSREPDPEELEIMPAYLAERSDRPAAAVQQLVWALLASPEFRFNH